MKVVIDLAVKHLEITEISLINEILVQKIRFIMVRILDFKSKTLFFMK